VKIVAPGDDAVEVPPPVTETPAPDRYCDLVMTGGVASGVVYPWAIIELARHFHFRSISGTSVGAIGACLTAAAEYGRRAGFEHSFEAIRRLPANLGEEVTDQQGQRKTRMLSLFQPSNEAGQRLLQLFVDGVRLWYEPRQAEPKTAAEAPTVGWAKLKRIPGLLWGVYKPGMRAALGECALVLLAFGSAVCWSLPAFWAGLTVAALALWCLGIAPVVKLLRAAHRELTAGLVENHFGLCTGRSQGGRGGQELPSFVEWMHEGIQTSAGRLRKDRPLSFEDLRLGADFPGTAPQGRGGTRREPGIVLQVMTTSISHYRPYRLPLPDQTSRLYYRKRELESFFPPEILDALVTASVPYAPARPSDPPAEEATDLLELPGERMPIVVAARLSMSFPLLFSAVPLYAVDTELAEHAQAPGESAPTARSRFLRCWFSDGGICSNFPIHLFDEALPTWPTFGLWLSSRLPGTQGSTDPRDAVQLAGNHLAGLHDAWNRFDAASRAAPPKVASGPGSGSLGLLALFMGSMVEVMRQWHQFSALPLPHVRTRVAWLRLREDEGDLNIRMPRAQILKMAAEYGTAAGRAFVERYVKPGQAAPSWSEHRWLRLNVLLQGMREMLSGLSAAGAWSAHTVPIDRAIDDSVSKPPLQDTPCLTPAQAEALREALRALETAEQALARTDLPQPCVPAPMPEWRPRAPL
jgi:predicted acylesterase/phospholipase RssA